MKELASGLQADEVLGWRGKKDGSLEMFYLSVRGGEGSVKKIDGVTKYVSQSRSSLT